MSSDSTGEIFVVTKEDGSGVANVNQVSNTSSNHTPSNNVDGAGMTLNVGSLSFWVSGLAFLGVLL